MGRMFDEVKVGDKLYAIGLGEAIVINVDKDSFNVIGESNIFRTYYKDGKSHIFDIEPSIFWEKPKLEYIKEKPFDLEDELRKLEIKEFSNEEANYYLLWDNKREQIKYNFINHCQNPLDIYFTDKSLTDFIKNIEDKKITKKQFFTAYRNVFGGIMNE